jgi:Transglycosylase-like domain
LLLAKLVLTMAAIAVMVGIGQTEGRTGNVTQLSNKQLIARFEYLVAKPSPLGCKHARVGVVHYRHATWKWQKMRDGKLADKTPVVSGKSCRWANYAADVHRERSVAAKIRTEKWLKNERVQRLIYFRELYEKWRCIHEHEGAWNSNTGNGYYGGLQMDYSFQSAYGSEFMARWGTADRWPVWAQLTAAERAYASRGFNPWPNTARMCGVL